MEESQAGVHQSDPQFIAGINHNLISSRACRSCDVLNTALHTDRKKRHERWLACKLGWLSHMLKSVYMFRVQFTRLARSMLSLKGKKASELTVTACRELIQFFFSVADRNSGTSSYMDFQTSRSGPCKHKTHIRPWETNINSRKSFKLNTLLFSAAGLTVWVKL